MSTKKPVWTADRPPADDWLSHHPEGLSEDELEAHPMDDKGHLHWTRRSNGKLYAWWHNTGFGAFLDSLGHEVGHQ